MKELTLFYMNGCPYCRNAKKAETELRSENAAYRDVTITWINEVSESALADTYDYYYVPSVYLGREKLYEAHPGESYTDCKDMMARCFEKALIHE